jgi:hypothetical protein
LGYIVKGIAELSAAAAAWATYQTAQNIGQAMQPGPEAVVINSQSGGFMAGNTAPDMTSFPDAPADATATVSTFPAAEANTPVMSTVTSNEARRAVMREQGIPTSQQPETYTENESGKEYLYKVPKTGGGTEIKSVQDQTKDRNHTKPHWEAGSVKLKDNGEKKLNKYGRSKLDGNKSKMEYDP